MAISVIMPALEMAQETGKLIAWRKKEGESVAKGEVLLEIETDKAVMEIEAEGDGVLAGVKVQEGAVVPVGQTIAWIVKPGETPPAEVAGEAGGSSGAAATRAGARPGTAFAASAAAVSGGKAGAAAEASSASATSGEAKASPKARRAAKEHGVDLGQVRGTGPEGVISTEDVLAYVEARKSGGTGVAAGAGSAVLSAGAGKVEKPGTVGRLMAERTTQSWTTVPHFFVTREVDAGALSRLREKLVGEIERSRGVRITHTDLLVALVARVLVKHPRVNASWTAEGIRLNPEVNVGVAMAVDDGVVAAVIRKANTASVAEIAAQRKDLAERARAGKSRPGDLAGGTFTISNLGMFGVDTFSAIISPPQAAILAVGRIAERVVPVEGKPGIRPMMSLTLSSDHRVIDGARAAEFLNDLAEAIGAPEKWVE